MLQLYLRYNYIFVMNIVSVYTYIFDKTMMSQTIMQMIREQVADHNGETYLKITFTPA